MSVTPESTPPARSTELWLRARPALRPRTFAWDESGRLLFDADTQRLSYEYLSDAAPLLVATGALEATFELELTADQVNQLNGSDGSEFLTLPIHAGP